MGCLIVICLVFIISAFRLHVDSGDAPGPSKRKMGKAAKKRLAREAIAQSGVLYDNSEDELLLNVCFLYHGGVYNPLLLSSFHKDVQSILTTMFKEMWSREVNLELRCVIQIFISFPDNTTGV